MFQLVAVLAWFALAPAPPVTIVVQDSSGAPLKNELVIVQDLNAQRHEITRTLTDASGSIALLQLTPGLYRAIATAPYGLWETEVREFLVSDKSVTLVLKVQPKPTQGRGDVAIVGARHARILVLDASNKPVAGVSILTRDRDATSLSERWYSSDAKGIANVELPSDPAIVVIHAGDRLITRVVTVRDSEVTIHLPNEVTGHG
jgi:hypothetical protein